MSYKFSSTHCSTSHQILQWEMVEEERYVYIIYIAIYVAMYVLCNLGHIPCRAAVFWPCHFFTPMHAIIYRTYIHNSYKL